MNFTFLQILSTVMGLDAAFRIVNQARVIEDYLLNSFLPERARPTYDVSDGNMRIIPTMAGIVGMDSHYPEGGVITVSKFMEQTAKIAHAQQLTEESLRQLQALVQRYQAIGDAAQAQRAVVNTVINFVQQLLLQPHLDKMEYLRGRALQYGMLDVVDPSGKLTVDYGVPAANKFDTRTTASGEAYGAAGSKFWEDWRNAKRKLNASGVRAVLCHADTWDEIVNNQANNIVVTGITGDRIRVVSFQKAVALQVPGNGNGPALITGHSDAREMGTVVLYSRQAAIMGKDADGRAVAEMKPFLERGILTFIGNDAADTFRVGDEPTPNPDDSVAVGYTHIAPTTEGNGAPGRWARVFTPEGMPMQLRGEAVTNGLPVLQAPDKIVNISTEMAA